MFPFSMEALREEKNSNYPFPLMREPQEYLFAKRLLETIPGLVCIYNIHTGMYLYINNTLKKMLGYSKKEWYEKGLSFTTSLVHPEDVGPLMKKNAEAVAKLNENKKINQIVEFEYRMKHKNGSWRWVKTDGIVFERNERGQIETVMNISIDITKRKKEELGERENRKKAEVINNQNAKTMEDIYEQFTDAIYIIDKLGRYVYLNRAAEKQSGMSKNELVGKNWLEVSPKAKNTLFYQTIKETVAKGVSKQIEVYYPPQDKWYETTYYPTPNSVIIFSKDITKQKKLNEIEKYYKAIVTFSDDAIISKNLNGIITSWNRAAEKMFDHKANETIGKPITIIIPTNLKEEEKKIIQQIKLGHSIDHYETTRVAKNGSQILVSLTISPIKNEQGKIIGASKIARDITRQKRAEENLRFLSNANKILSSSLDYEKTLQSVAKIAIPHIADWCAIDFLGPDGQLIQVAVAHRDPNKIEWAKEYRKSNPPDMNGTMGGPYVIKTGKPLLFPEISDKMIVAAAKNRRELMLARKLKLKSAMIVPIVLHKKPIGAISFIATDSGRYYSTRDLTMAEELSSRASLAIENASLYKQAQEEIERRKQLEKQKDEFIGVASHELKTPVTSIKSFAQVLRLRFSKEGNTQAADLLAKLDTQINKLASLIEDLLDVTKISAGRMQYNEEYFDFDKLVDELIEELQRITERHIITRKGSTKETIYADRERVGQVITNLVTNATKYSPKGKKVLIKLSSDKKMVKLCVKDFGIGIESEKQKKVFERFFRASRPGENTFPGLGLGLYVSSEIIQRLGGDIWVESTLGKGSTFCFRLPIKQQP